MGKLCNNGRFVNVMLIFAYPIGVLVLWMNKWITHKFRKVVGYFYLWHCIILPIYVSVISVALELENTMDALADFVATLLMVSVPVFIMAAIILKIQGKKCQNGNNITQNGYEKWDDLKNGDTVNSEAFGVGVVLNKTYVGPDEFVLVDFQNCGKKTLHLSTAHLKKIKAVEQSTAVFTNSTGNTVFSTNMGKKSESSLPYEKASLLTNNERNFYETIRLIAEKLNMNVLSKVRLADIVNVNRNIQSKTFEWWGYFKQISQKHIDFALADKGSLEIKLVIEVDDSSHKRADRIERDRFVDQVLSDVGIPILHIEDVIGLEDKINHILLENEKSRVEM